MKFGSEGSFAIGNSSMIVSPYRRHGRDAGSLGIIGPMRVDYKKIIPCIEYLTQKISLIMSDGEDDDNTATPKEDR